MSKTQKWCLWKRNSESRMVLGPCTGIISKSQWRSANLNPLPIQPLISKEKIHKKVKKNYPLMRKLIRMKREKRQCLGKKARARILRPEIPLGRVQWTIKILRNIIVNKDRGRTSRGISNLSSRIIRDQWARSKNTRSWVKNLPICLSISTMEKNSRSFSNNTKMYLW